ncbi:ABC transporter permease [Danxiaibacter flavus]|uniref:ABC transporter permease n=1 Tax=Danxiaibacter flavus TaxID=3049108 RepID=A0ABV3ZCG8_9BACT|nr:ABC transporter permease [Chitinophagaceae bacterium DXS]
MFGNYFKIAWRSLIRNKAFSFINIFGLALGLMCSILIMLWVNDEYSVDRFHSNGDYLYQIYERQYYDGKINAGYSTQGLLADELKKNVPELQYASAMDRAAAPGASSTFEAGNKINKMDGYFAGSDFFSMFSYPLLKGKADAALSSPSAIAISRKMADMFFGDAANAIGKTIRYENKEDLEVTAVFDDLPANSSMQFDFVRSWIAYVRDNAWVKNWGNTSPSTYIQLRKDAEPKKVEAKIKHFIYNYRQKDPASRTELALQSYPDKYLHSNFSDGQINGGRIEYVHLFTLVAIFTLLIACINFMNLATAQSGKRAKEVGLRKVIGAVRSSLIGQFIGEAVLLTLVSIFIAILLVVLLLPAFNSVTGKQLSLPFNYPMFWIILAGLIVVTGLTAGSYPAIFLSSMNPVQVFKSGIKAGWGAVFFRKVLVVFQFSLSVLLIVGMIVIYRQMNYIQSRNLGYDRDNLIYVPIEGDLVKNYSVFKNKAANVPGIINVSKMRNSPTIIEHHTGSIYWQGKDPNLEVSFADGVVGYDFVKTMKLEMAAGRDFSKEFSSDSTAYIINETAAKRIGYQDPVGQTIKWGNHPGTIIGVVKDFHFNSLHQAIDPLIMRLDENWSWGTILIRVQGGKTKDVLTQLEKICKELNPKFPFAYQFSDLEYARLYKSEQVVSKLSGFFAFLAIFISCLGLFGLATFTAAQRTKEIGVRKVLGASVANIAGMLSGDFLKLVGIAFIIAFPVAWLVMNNWLQNFAYKINIEWWMFAVAGFATVCIALLTVSYQSIKAALNNPVNSLRTE